MHPCLIIIILIIIGSVARISMQVPSQFNSHKHHHQRHRVSSSSSAAAKDDGTKSAVTQIEPQGMKKLRI